MNIVLAGMPGSGKTAAGKLLAKGMARLFIDTDSIISSRMNKSITRIFDEDGESFFRRAEGKLCDEISRTNNAVIAVGGGTFLNRNNLIKLTESGIIFTLTCGLEEILSRIQNEEKKRPLLSGKGRDGLNKMARRRMKLYAGLPNRVDTTGLSPEKTADVILSRLRGKEHRLDIEVDGKVSSVMIKNGAAEHPLGFIASFLRENRIFVVSDSRVFSLYGKKLRSVLEGGGLHSSFFLLQPGERSKSLTSVKNIYRWLIREKASRSSLVLAFGGGVVSDTAGFAVSTFLRGLRWAVMPTTLLAQVDAGIGGKTGVNIEGGKNQVGTFFFPETVLVDPLLCATLDRRRMREGLAEALKSAMVQDVGLYDLIRDKGRDLLLKDLGLLEEVIVRTAGVKTAIVGHDPYEMGERKHLNLGHTFGHALESWFKHRRLTHGEAVGLGLLCALRMACEMGHMEEKVIGETREILKNLGLPVYLEGLPVREVVSLMSFDKKREAGLTFVVPQKCGFVGLEKNVEQDLIIRGLKEVIRD
ncbi:MAG: 3-dehydroquinate synthase [Candidatus Aminicenantes bacterium]|nr:3-dehydroquinate synthase [Candidatus Aminicenantes bacterium]